MEHKRKRASLPSDDLDKSESEQLLVGKFEEPHEGVPQMVGAVQYAAAVRATDKMQFPSTKASVGGFPPIQIRVPSEKVCFVVGPGGETLEDIWRRSGAYVKVIPRHLAEGDQSKERTVCIYGGEIQVEMAKATIKQALNQSLPCTWDNHFKGTVFEDKQPVPCHDLKHCTSIW